MTEKMFDHFDNDLLLEDGSEGFLTFLQGVVAYKFLSAPAGEVDIDIMKSGIFESENPHELGLTSISDTEYFSPDDYIFDFGWFRNFCSVLMKQYEFKSEADAYLSAWLLIIRLAPKVLSKTFTDHYCSEMLNYEELNIDKNIVKFLSINSIGHSNQKLISLLTYYLMGKNCFSYDLSYLRAREVVVGKVSEFSQISKVQDLETTLLEESGETQAIESKVTINDVDFMGGQEFEIFIRDLFVRLGFDAYTTKASGDQGVDIVAEKGTQKIAIQAKRYSGVVPNSAIQEVVAGAKHYQCNKTIVVTNNYFTQSANDLALTNNVILWDRNILKEKLGAI
jgi:hypothetical protein